MRTKYFLILFVLLLACSKGNETVEPTIINPITNDNTDNANPEVNEVSFQDFELNFKYLMNTLNMPGGQVAIIKNEKLVYLKSFGLASVENGAIVNNESLFRIASISKPITALAILKLVSDNKLELTNKVFGDNAILGNEYGTLEYSQFEERINIRHLLEHKSGFTNDPYDIMFDDVSLSLKELIDKVLDNRDPSSSPGERYYYSNFGYCVLGRIIEKISGVSYEEYVTNEVLKPMGITEMKIGGNTINERFSKEVTYYSNWFDPYGMNVRRMDSHGGWVASAKDLAKFAVHSDTQMSVKDLLEKVDMDLYFQNGFWNHYGALPGNISIINVGSGFSFVVLFNGSSSNFESELDQVYTLMNEEILLRTKWPNVNLFD